MKTKGIDVSALRSYSCFCTGVCRTTGRCPSSPAEKMRALGFVKPEFSAADELIKKVRIGVIDK
jgi:hypothetical protein